MHSHWSLVAFTLLFQASVGSIWCLLAAHFMINTANTGLPVISHLTAALALSFAGMAAALAHLSNPRAGLFAIANLRHSWLSREIFFVHVHAGALALLIITTPIRPKEFDVFVLSGASLAGAILLYSMSRVYQLKTVPSWNHSGTLLSFVGSALVLGGSQFALVQTICAMTSSTGHDAVTADIYVQAAIIAAVSGSLIKMTLGLYQRFKKKRRPAKSSHWPVFHGSGVILCVIFLLLAKAALVELIALSLAAIILVGGEISHRIAFYHSYDRVGL